MKKIVALVLSVVMVMGLATTAFAAFSEDADYYIKEVGGAGFSATVAVFVPADAEDDGTGNVDHFLHDTVQYVECAKADATHEIWDGNMAGDKRVAYVAAAEADYTMVMTKVAASALFTCTTDKNAKGYKHVDTVGNVTYYKDSTTSDVFALVGDEVVEVAPQTVGTATAESVVGGHIYVQNKAAAKDAAETVYEYKCVVCGSVVDAVTGNNKTAGVKYVPYFQDANTLAVVAASGYDTDGAAAMLWIVADAAASAPATDKVESAQTFDAGIAMYVGMSVMAAAGSAVCLKKKD